MVPRSQTRGESDKLNMFAYTVICQFEDAEFAAEWGQWLLESHVSQVCEAGGCSAEVIELDGRVPAFEVRYRFPSREAFEHYEAKKAAELRQDALARIPHDKRVTFTRNTGQVRGRFEASPVGPSADS